ncbi:hypothetical protein [Sphingomonas sp.]|uniref:hypothetical protein n=1 Tax=Sphingomonas sp. TaxID=28214 RepID=UPI0025F92BCB|nr:hypothetical protein [Sphingomonas sp.]
MATTNVRRVPGWYWAAAIAAVLFMAVGCAGMVMDMMTDPHSLEPAQRALYIARPPWMKLAYTLAVWSGLAGALVLLVRWRAAVPVLLVSLVATVFTFLPYAIVPGVRAAVQTGDVVAAVIVIALVALTCAFARHSRRQGWLR